MEDALLAAICAQPDDIAARLVFADYLLEQSDPAKRDRGEFILAQCRRAAGGLPGAEEYDLRKREQELLEKYRAAWLAPLAGLVANAAFTRGFPDRVTMTVDQFADKFDAAAKLTPVARLHLTGAAGVLAELAEYEQLRGVVGLDLSREHISSVGLRELLASPRLSRLSYLNLADNLLADAGADVLAESPLLKRLQFLGVARCGITSGGVSRLLSRVGPGLRWLNLRGNTLAPGDWADALLGRLPSKAHPALRLSLEAQLGRYRLTKPQRDPGPLPRLKATAALPPEIASWVKALDITTAAHFVAAIGANQLPADVRRAFVKVCERRVEWVARREWRGAPAMEIPRPAATDPQPLAEYVRRVLDFTWKGQVHREAGTKPNRRTKSTSNGTLWLRDWLLRLFEHHAAGTLDPEGRTR